MIFFWEMKVAPFIQKRCYFLPNICYFMKNNAKRRFGHIIQKKHKRRFGHLTIDLQTPSPPCSDNVRSFGHFFFKRSLSLYQSVANTDFLAKQIPKYIWVFVWPKNQYSLHSDFKGGTHRNHQSGEHKRRGIQSGVL